MGANPPSSPARSVHSQEWTGSTKFRKSWGELSDQTKPSAEGDFSRDVKCNILDFRLTPAARQGVEPQREKRSARNFVADTQEVPETCHWMRQVHNVLYSLVP